MNLDLFNKLEDFSEDSVNNVLASLKSTNEKVFYEFDELVSSLEKTPAGQIKASASNLRKVSTFENKFSTFFAETDYYSSVGSFISNYSDNSKLINTYFSSFPGFDPKNKIYGSILNYNVEYTVDTLMESGISEYFKKPLINSLRQSIVEGVSKTDLLKSLRAEIMGTIDRKPRLERYVKQVATDAVNQFNGNYIGSISNDLGLSHYFYKGTKIEETRPFCIHLTGKFMKESQLREYVNNESKGKGWAGMIPGTNFGNIITRRGGYNCRHTIIPVSKEVYEASKNKL